MWLDSPRGSGGAKAKLTVGNFLSPLFKFLSGHVPSSWLLRAVSDLNFFLTFSA